MKILKLQRTFKEGFSNFVRNGWLSVATISVISISLLIIGFTLSIGIAAKTILRNMQDKVSVSVYFNPDVSEERILTIKKEIEERKYEEVKAVEYVSKEQALEELLALDPSIQKAVDEVGENPLLSSLSIKANRPDQYEVIAGVFQEKFGDEVGRINYEKNKLIIERVARTIGTAEKSGLVLAVIFVLLAVLITFNTVRITIYSHKKEFEIMRLVGASNLYVQMPFFFEGILYGVFASLLAFALLIGAFFYFNSLGSNFFELTGLNFAKMGMVFLAMLVIGVFLGVVSSLFAIQRYLKK